MLGVFDSGLGGLSSVKELARCLPKEDVVYFGDTGRVPYGTRSKETIIKYALQDARFLMQFDPKAILVACGTVSSVAMEALQNTLSVPVIGVVDAAVGAALSASKNQKIAVLGTPATIRSGSYRERLLGQGVQVLSIPCPLFVPLVENGHIREDDPIVKETVAHYLHQALSFGADTIILGCTHYPLLKRAIGTFVGEDVKLINAAAEAAHCLADRLEKDGLLAADGGEQRFFVSDSPEGFADTARIFLKKDIKEAVERIDIEAY
ncbi:MAG: glutamate racemase [Clostridia bacterium]|nr:glutamate racemase [Clostridia bacterium]